MGGGWKIKHVDITKNNSGRLTIQILSINSKAKELIIVE